MQIERHKFEYNVHILNLGCTKVIVMGGSAGY